ncbi:response regulator transcription factor [Paucisalibacillus sp. EB02]|uniref:response regulator transcription factor n=1 Tax=Paucisalibacillus sp. EB02 TaxID=1347087 RepID=UPI0004AC638E|nr:response regulator transcription factor [Paucisalibacillus sp. EB02]
MANERILIVDDDHDMLEVLGLYFRNEGYNTFTANDPLKAIQFVEEVRPALIILDVMMPQLDGFELCHLIRKKSDVPILFLSSKDEDIDKIIGLGIGGDDYLSKTTSPSVIIAKVKAYLRRTRIVQNITVNQTDNVQKDESLLVFPGMTINLSSAVVKINGSEIKLAAKEYQLLTIMARNPGRIYSVEQLFDLIWGEDSLGDYRTVMVHISNLRKKIESLAESLDYIITIRGIGYKFQDFSE